jgi:antitoxin ParD1/3/4
MWRRRDADPECCADEAPRKAPLVGSGRYQNASEVLRDGLRLVEQREAKDAAKLEALREAAGVGAAALDRGEFKEFENIEELQTYLNELSEKVISGTAQ